MLGVFIYGMSVFAAFLTVLAVFSATGARPTPLRLLRYAAVTATVLLILMVGVFNALPGFFVGNQKAYDVTRWLRGAGPAQHALADPRIHLVLIDNGNSKELVVDPDHFRPPALLTHRGELTELLHWLADRSDGIAYVVCDMLFLERTDHDDTLAAAMHRLAGQGKLLLAKSDSGNVAPFRFDDSVLFDATASLQEERIAWHKVLPHGKPSLPYAMYLRSTGTTARPFLCGRIARETTNGESHCRYPAFMPGFHLLDHEGFFPGPADKPGSVEAPELAPLSLHEAITEFGRYDLEQHMADRSRPPPVIFIGGFSSPTGESSDMHETFVGRQRGSTLILALYLELMAGVHHIHGATLLLQWIILVVLLFFLFMKPWRKPLVPADPAKGPDAASRPPTMARVVLHSLCKFLKGLPRKWFPEILLVTLFFALEVWTGEHVNLAALLLYFAVLHAFIAALHLPHPPVDEKLHATAVED